MTRAFSLLLCSSLVACSSKPSSPPHADSLAVAPVPQDSLVLVVEDSFRVYLTAGRRGTSSDGVSCQEYGVRIAGTKGSRLVPLLYVRTAPWVEMGRLFATVSSDCAAGDEYVIDLATAHPTLLPGGRR